LTGPLFTVCGAVPEPGRPLTCSPDVQALNALNQLSAIDGVPTLFEVRPSGEVVEQTILIEDKLPPPANSLGLGNQVSGVLDCKAPQTPSTATPTHDGSGLEPMPSFAAPVVPTPLAIGPASALPASLPSLAPPRDIKPTTFLIRGGSYLIAFSIP